MRVLFLTTAEIPLLQEHYFTINVALGLKKLYSTHDDDQITYASLQFRPGITPHISKLENQSIDTYSIYIDNSCSHEKLITDIAQQLTKLKPDIIHSQLLDGYDIEAASIMRTPIFNTIHVGGFICPRSTINGFLRPNDSICNLSVGPQCKECMYQELPFPKIAEALHPIVSHGKFGNFLSNHQPPIFYLTPLAKINENLSIRRNLFPIFNKSNIIAANKQLVELLKINGIHDLVHYLPHGVKERRRLEFPTVKNGKIHFYILNRIQHCKGVHIVLEALKGIPKDKYELHIIGGYPPSIMGKQYFHKIKHMAKGPKC